MFFFLQKEPRAQHDAGTKYPLTLEMLMSPQKEDEEDAAHTTSQEKESFTIEMQLRENNKEKTPSTGDTGTKNH